VRPPDATRAKDAAFDAARGTMDRIRIRGGMRLKGEIPISGAKNSALKLMAASLLTDEPVTLRNIPRLADVAGMGDLLMQFGVTMNIRRGASLGHSNTMRLHAG